MIEHHALILPGEEWHENPPNTAGGGIARSIGAGRWGWVGWCTATGRLLTRLLQLKWRRLRDRNVKT